MSKILIIYPESTKHEDSPFYIFDPETGEVLASHFCSGSGWAKSDLHDGRPERLKEWKEKYGQDTKAVFIDQSEYSWEDVYKKNQELGKQAKENAK